MSIHTVPDPWPWLKNCLEQWSDRVFLFNSVTLPFNKSGKKVWNKSVDHHWSHSNKARHCSALESIYGTWTVCQQTQFAAKNKFKKIIKKCLALDLFRSGGSRHAVRGFKVWQRCVQKWRECVRIRRLFYIWNTGRPVIMSSASQMDLLQNALN